MKGVLRRAHSPLVTDRTIEPGSEAPAARPAGAKHDVRAIYAAHGDFVWANLQRLGVREADLEDMAQEVFVVVHQRLHTFDGSSKMTTWLFGICLRVAAAYRRKAYVVRERVGEELPDESDGRASTERGATPEQALAEQQARARLEALLDTLDLEKRAVFVMFELEELSCEQIALELEVPVGTVYSRLHAARKAFAKALARWQSAHARQGGRA